MSIIGRIFERKYLRPAAIVEKDFFRRKIKLNRSSLRNLSRFPLGQYVAVLCLVVKVARMKRIDSFSIDPFEKVRSINFDQLPDAFLLEQIKGFTLNLKGLREKLNQFRKRPMAVALTSMEISPPVKPAVEARTSTQEVFILDASKLLTDDLLFNPRSGVLYPRNAAEYRELIAGIVDEKGRFPGDAEALTPQGTFAPKMKGVRQHDLKRKGKTFQVEIFSPHLHAQGVRNRLIFDADLISQAASNEAYGTPGVSYDRESYYVRRLYNAEIVPFIRQDGFPVSFAAMQGYQMAFQERDSYYAFIHFVMTRGTAQGYGLTSYSVREGMSSLFYSNVWRNRTNLMFDSQGRLTDYRFRMWAFAHSGRFTPFYAFVKGFGGVDPSWAPIAHAMMKDVHRRITPPEELVSRGDPKLVGAKKVNGGQFPIAVDEGVYPENTRYPLERGRIIFPQSEVDLSSSIRDIWLEAIGGEQGVADGNGLYFGGLVTFGRIQAAKKKESMREGGMVEGAGDRVRSWAVRHSK